MYKYRFVNIVIILSLVVLIYSCADNPTEPKPEPKKYIPVDTASRYEWTSIFGWFPTSNFIVIDTSNIFIATGSKVVKYDGIQFSLLELDDNRFYCQGLFAVNKDCIFFSGETRVGVNNYYPTIKRYYNGKITTYDLPSDTLSTVFAVYGISPEEFWALDINGKLYNAKNGVIKTYNEFIGRHVEGGFFRYPDGRLFLITEEFEIINKLYAKVTVSKIVNEEITKISEDTFNYYDLGLYYSLNEDILLNVKSELYNFEDNHWIKFFDIDDLDPYFVNGILACGGRSKNEFMFTPSTGFPLLLRDNKWSWEKYPSFGYINPQIIYYDDRIYFIAEYFQANGSYLYKGKLKHNKH